MEEKAIESKSSDFQNIFEELLGKSDKNILGDIKAYTRNNPKNVIFLSEIFNGDVLVWKGQLDLTKSEKAIRVISEKLDTILNLVNVNENKVVASFNKGKIILGLDFKNSIKRNLENKQLVNIYNKK